MSGSNVFLALKDDSEAAKINQILLANDYTNITSFNCETGQLITSGDVNSDLIDINSFDLTSFDLILTDENINDNEELNNLLKETIEEKDIPLIHITSNSRASSVYNPDFNPYSNPQFNPDFNPNSDIIPDSDVCRAIDLRKNKLYLSIPYKPQELLLTMELAFYKNKMKNALYESEDRYRLLIENANDPIAMINYDGEFILVNRSAARFFGCETEKFQGKTMWDVFPKNHADSQIKDIRNVLDSGKGEVFEGKTVIKGKERYFRTNIQPMPIRNGGKKMVQLIAHDITPLKQAGKALQKSEEKFREVFNNAHDGVSLHTIGEDGLPGIFSEVNDVVCQRLGYTREELLKMSPKDTINQKTLQKLPRIMENLNFNRRATFEAVQITKSGDEIITEITNHLFHLQGNKMVMAISRDISERKQIEEQLLRVLAGIEGTWDAIGISMPDGSHFYHNQSFNELFGYRVDELNEPLGSIKLFADQEMGHEIVNTIMRGKNWEGELNMLDKTERVFPAFIQANAIKNDNNKVIGLIYVVNDITDRKKAEYALKTSEEKFQNLAQTALDAIIIIDREEKIVFCNSSLEKIFDYGEEEILGAYLDTLIPQQYTEDFQIKLDYFHQQDLEVGNVFESFGLRKDGSEFPLEMSLNTWKSEGEIYTTLILRDITQRKLNEFKMKMREDIFQLMSQNIEEVFWIIDPLTGQILYMSPSYHKIWGQTIENLYQNPRSWIESIHSSDKQKFISYIFGKNGVNTMHREGIECRVLRPDGKLRWIKVRAFPVINQNKEIYRRVGIATDISRLKNNGKP